MISRGGEQEEGERTSVLEMMRGKRQRSAKLDRLVRKMALELVDDTTIVDSGGIQGEGYVPIINAWPDDDYPDGEQYPKDMTDNSCRKILPI